MPIHQYTLFTHFSLIYCGNESTLSVNVKHHHQPLYYLNPSNLIEARAPSFHVNIPCHNLLWRQPSQSFPRMLNYTSINTLMKEVSSCTSQTCMVKKWLSNLNIWHAHLPKSLDFFLYIIQGSPDNSSS